MTAIHAYVANNAAAVLNSDELLRAEWVARVSALDLYIHELVAQKMLETFEGARPATDAYKKFQISNETVARIRAASLNDKSEDAVAAFDLDVRTQLSELTFQNPEKIANGIRLVSNIELWNEVALKLGSTPGTKNDDAKQIRKELSVIVQRRNKIAHEGDLQPTPPRVPWPISQAGLQYVAQRIETIVRAVDALV